MHRVLSIFLLLSWSSRVVIGDEEADFFRDCPPKRCSSDGPEVRFPLRLKSESSPKFCGFPGLDLSCSGNQTLLTLPSAAYAVTTIDYTNRILTTQPLGPQRPCPLANLTHLDNSFFTGTLFSTSFLDISLLCCSNKFTPQTEGGLAGPISCLGGEHGFVYAASDDTSMANLPLDCMVVGKGGSIPYNPYNGRSSFEEAVDNFLGEREIAFDWWAPEIENCQECETKGRRCWFSSIGNQMYCASSRRHGPRIMLITGTSIGGLFLILISIAFILFYISRRFDKEKEERLKVEKFLATYKTTNPTRYTFSDIKKITKGFRQKLGQGGFGSVYKGQLPNGILVAVKMLLKSRGEGEEFTNEVATIGRIHHVNVVRLLGFCCEGTRYALVYEFMPNESLEKFIFSKEAEITRSPLSMEKLHEITVGVARGIEYLHQGCKQRILHFDIKPHNILLDHDFNPKISDFGLAKLCSREVSIVTMTAARGTMGYIAPEMYSRNFGTVSDKSDVYSFGMLVLEMVGGRRNTDPTIQSQGEIYFPESVYNQLSNGQELGLMMNTNVNDEELAKKLAIVSLWCIQWSPMDRPSMTKVVEMLIGDLSSLELPPKPFVPSTDEDNSTSLNII